METDQAPVVTSMVSIVGVRKSATDLEAIILGAFDAHARRLKAFAVHAVRDADAADDRVQETFLRFVQEARSGLIPDNVGWPTGCDRSS